MLHETPRKKEGHGRRALVVRSALTVALAMGVLGIPFLTAAQPGQKVFRVGYLAAGARTPDGLPPAALRKGLRTLGYVEGQNIAYEARFNEGRLERLAGLAAELVSLKVDVIATLGGPATAAAKAATSTIPIVMARPAGDALAAGWIVSLARPGGNVTGLTDETAELSAKRMELLKEVVPKATAIAVLWNANDPGMTLRYRGIEKAARVLRIDVHALGVSEPGDFPAAFATMTRRRPDALFLVADALTVINRKQVIEFAATQRIPAMYEFELLVRDGGLVSYGTRPADDFHRAAFFIDRILKGAKPSELPAEQPMNYYLTVNLKTATTLGLTIPPSLLLRANDVIQ